MLNARDGDQGLSGSFTTNCLRSASPELCEVTGKEAEAPWGWPQAVQPGRARGGTQTLIRPTPLIP